MLNIICYAANGTIDHVPCSFLTVRFVSWKLDIGSNALLTIKCLRTCKLAYFRRKIKYADSATDLKTGVCSPCIDPSV